MDCRFEVAGSEEEENVEEEGAYASSLSQTSKKNLAKRGSGRGLPFILIRSRTAQR